MASNTNRKKSTVSKATSLGKKKRPRRKLYSESDSEYLEEDTKMEVEVKPRAQKNTRKKQLTGA